MGKPKGRKVPRSDMPGWRQPKASSPSLASATSVETIIEKVQVYMESFDFTLAEKFANRGIERFPEDSQMLEAAAQCFIEVGHIQKARTCYEKAISHSPLKGWRKYLGLAQLLEGKESLLQYTRGIEVMEREVADKFARDNPQPDPFASMKSPSETSAQAATEVPSDYPTPRDISDAYLSISELYTTDLCDEGNAEEMCRYAIEKAMMADPKNPECFQQMANLYLIKGDKERAKEYVRGGLSLWYQYGNNSGGAIETGPVNSQIGVDHEEGEDIPPLAFQIDTAKSLIECEEFALAARLVSEFLAQSPGDPEMWYLSGLCCFLRGKDYYPHARSDFQRAKELSTTPHGVCYDVIAQCDEHLQSIGAVLPVGEDDSDEEAADEFSVASKRNDTPIVEVDEDWETDEEETRDVQMH